MSSQPAPTEPDSFGPTRAEQDRRLLIRYHREGDELAREELVQRLLPLARRMARRYRRRTAQCENHLKAWRSSAQI